MQMLLLYFFFQFFLPNISTSSSTLCYGGRAEYLPMGCEDVIGFPLIIEGFDYELTRHTDVGRRLSSIKRVNNGIIIRRNSFQRFTAMKSLQFLGIGPGKGPSLILEFNFHLISLEFPDLRVINGTMPIVSFWHDNFPFQMRKNNNAFQQFLDFLAAAGHFIHPCSPDYFDLHFMDEHFPSDHWYFVLVGSLGALAVVMIIDTIWYTGFQQWWEKKLYELELAKERVAYDKLVKQWDLDEKWKKEAEEIVENERGYMDDLKLNDHDPFYAPGELQKWRNEKLMEKVKEMKKKKFIEDRIRKAKAKEQKIRRQWEKQQRKFEERNAQIERQFAGDKPKNETKEANERKKKKKSKKSMKKVKEAIIPEESKSKKTIKKNIGKK